MIKRSLFCLILLLAPGPVSAEPTVTGTLDATAFEPLPARLPLQVVPSMGLAGAQDLKRLFEESLRNAGYEITATNAYRFDFRFSQKIERTEGRAPVTLQGSGGSGSDRDDTAVTLRWRVKRAGENEPPRDHVLTITLIDPAGHVVWEARAELRSDEQDPYALLSVVAPSIIKQLGTAVSSMQLP